MLKPIFGLDLGQFPICLCMGLVGFIAGLISLNANMTKLRPLSPYVRGRIRGSFCWAAFFSLLFANFVNWFLIDGAWQLSLLERVTQVGFNLYAGLLCFFGLSALFLRMRRMDVWYCINLVVRSVLIALFFGRIGCSLHGCCWGVNLRLGETVIPFPARELEALFALILFFVLKNKWFQSRFYIFLYSYSIVRFALEFFRGDDRGELFGTFFSPTQLFILATLAILTVILLIKAIAGGRKNAYADPRRGYQPLPDYFMEPPGKHHPLRMLFVIFLVLALVFSAMVVFNPFQLAFFDNVRLAVSDTFSPLFAKGGTEQTIGTTTGLTIRRVEQPRRIAADNDAIALVKEAETWRHFDYQVIETRELPGGGTIYNCAQTIENEPVYGKSQYVVTDKSDMAQYIIGDDAQMSYSDEIIYGYASDAPTIAEKFNGAIVLEQKPFLYDTGEGLVHVNHVVLSTDGKTPAFGAIVTQQGGNLICTTSTAMGVHTMFDQAGLIHATESVLTLVRAGDEVSIQTAASHANAENDLEWTEAHVVQALAKGCQESGMSLSVYETVLASSLEIAQTVSDLTPNLYREIVAAQAEQALLTQADAKTAQRASASIHSAFESCGIRQRDDEAATVLVAESRRTTFTHSIDYDYDTDVFLVQGQPGEELTLQLRTGTPILAEVTNEAGRAIVRQYVSDDESITLYPADGSEFVLRVSDVKTAVAPRTKGANYRVSVQSVSPTDRIPAAVQTTLAHIEDAYRRSDMTAFLSMVADDGKQLSTENIMGYSMMMGLADTISGWFGVSSGVDSTKSVIAVALIPGAASNMTSLNPEQVMGSAMLTLRGSSLELECVDLRSLERGYAVKASCVIRQDSLDIYNGFTYLKLETAEANPDARSGSESTGFFSFFRSYDYYITDANNESLYALFGDSSSGIQGTSDLDSLYSMWIEQPAPDPLFHTRPVTLDRSRLQSGQYSEDKIEGFERYTARHNLTNIEMERAQLDLERQALSLVYTVGEPAKELYDLLTNPFGYIAGEIMAQNETTDALWTVAQYVVDPDGTITDLMFDVIFDAARVAEQNVAQMIDRFDIAYAPWVEDAKRRLGT